MEKVNKVLLVDDDSINNYINLRLFEKLYAGQNVDIVTNGKEALEYLRKLKHVNGDCPQLILLDINMPVMNGIEFLDSFCREVLCDEMPIIIILTTSNDPIDISRIRQYPAVAGFLNKPLTEEKLQGLMEKYFD